MATDSTVVTAGLGPDLGQRFTQAVSGTINMFGTLLLRFIPKGTAKSVSGGVSIDIDIAVD